MIFFLYGQDTFRSHEKLKGIKERFFTKVDPSEVNYAVLDGDSLSFDEFRQKVFTGSFFSSKRMVIIKNLLAENKNEDTIKNLSKLTKKGDKEFENVILIFLEDAIKEDLGKNKLTGGLFRLLLKNKYTQEFKPLSRTQLASWISDRVKQHKKTIEKDAITLLISLVGNDLWQMNNEIAKLSSYISNNQITMSDIHSMVKGKIDNNIFNLIDAVSMKNKKLALRLILDQLNSGINAIYLHTMITRHYRILIQVKSLLAEEKNERQILKKLNYHPYVISKAISQLKYYTMDELKLIYNQLFEMDIALKTSGKKPAMLFNLFISTVAS